MRKPGIAYQLFILLLILCIASCKKDDDPAGGGVFHFIEGQLDGRAPAYTYKGISRNPNLSLVFGEPVQRGSAPGMITLQENNGAAVPLTLTYSGADSVVTVAPQQPLKYLTKYTLSISDALKSTSGNKLSSGILISLQTGIDSSDKFQRISDTALVELVQRQTFKYFWDFGHPVSGMARERNSSGNLVTSGGSGFGVMAIVTGMHRNFITRQQGLQRLQQMVSFLRNQADTFRGAFPHWLDGDDGDVIPFSPKDNGADLVETSYLIMGLLTARQYFNGGDAAETALRNDINAIWHAVQWNWFRRGGQNVLYWHWSPNFGWDMNLPVRGWNESLITYVLAASSPTYPIPKVVYDEGWARNGAMRNGNTYLGYPLPLGPPYGGPLFYAHYSFLGINPAGLSDVYADYWTQNRNHTLINYTYCKNNPKGYYGYSDSCWGLTASDDISGYKVHDPLNDNSVITPTAALSSFPYTPQESMAALQFFYYKLGDKLWGPYGFYDAFSLDAPWFTSSTLAIDQGPIVVMMENYRSGLLWNLFMSCPEVKAGMLTLGFTSPYL